MRLGDALEGALYVTVPETIEEVFETFPTTADFATFWSGGAKKGTKKYLAARRRFERAKQGTRPMPAAVLRTIRRRIRYRRRRLEARPVKVVITGIVRVSRDTRRRTIHANLTADAMGQILEALGDPDELEEVFSDLFGAENLGGQSPEWEDVSSLSVT